MQVSKDMLRRFGADRIIDTPITEVSTPRSFFAIYTIFLWAWLE